MSPTNKIDDTEDKEDARGLDDEANIEGDAPEEDDPRLQAAWERLEAEDVDSAGATATTLLAEDPRWPEALLLAAACARESGDLEAATNFLRDATRVDKEWATPELWLAEIYALDERRGGDALRHARRAMDLAEDEMEFLEAAVLRARLALDQDREVEARSSLESVPPAGTVPLPSVLALDVADLLVHLGEAEEADTYLKDVTEAEPDNADAWHLRGLVAEERGNADERAAAWRRTRALDLAEIDKLDPAERLSEDTIEHETEAALAELPAELRARLANIPIIVTELPAEDDVADGADPRSFGLFTGTPLTEQASDAAPALTQILLFRRNLERLGANDEEDLRAEIRITLIHETGHFFGLDEDELARLGLA